jgi:beta-mannosidase
MAYKDATLARQGRARSAMANPVQLSLVEGWSFRDRDDAEGWMPVPAVPSVVHQDLMANKK